MVGGGITGVSAALHLAERGVASVVLDARGIGWGASGRAFGQVVPYLKHDAPQILGRYGPERGERIIRAIGDGPALVAGVIDRYGIDCDLRRGGLLFGAHAPSGEQTLQARAAFWQQRGAPVEVLSPTATQAAIGSDHYRMALLDHRGIHLNPYAYTCGLAAAAQARGARIVTGEGVDCLKREGTSWRLQAGPHVLEADTVILATNAYSGRLWPGLAESIVPIRGHGAVTAPLSDNQRRGILPGGQALTDTRRLFSGIRILPDGRLHASIDGPVRGPEAPPDMAKLDARIRVLFPWLAPVRWEETWSGFFAMTPDHFPRVHALAPGLFAGLGYSGRGIAAATMIGAELAARACGVPDRDLVFPLSPLKPIPGRRFAAVPVAAILAWWRWRDTIDDREVLRRR
ncbi:MAG TPA: FAD-binding oxidoreductase [Rhodopila sp.]|uniref:NAD(P)/FAD-dependent oxidoreductase n=1 Tax=Rhodopila sp. TaxID=2480087 RepID=UPI002D18DD8C|nr:FAD-binding oxidoreductase [Rhodopila sp.]HVY15550.1 FAD-binding oxidoreductase [Rhodopila sp.]